MSCYHPVKGFRTPNGVVFSELSRHDIIGSIELPCGMCIGCRMRRASDWTLRVMHEAQCWDENCFVTLTYARDALPPGGSLCHEDFQKFLKRLRKLMDGTTVRFFMCGEYGPLNLRPHYHACLFNVNFSDGRPSGKSASGAVFYDSPRLSKLWSHGIVSVQPLVRETAGYAARYVMKKALGFAGELWREQHPDLRPEYAAMSLKPGIGAAWFAKYGQQVYANDFVVMDGRKEAVPKFYDKLMKRGDPDRLELLKWAREKRALLHVADQTDDRLLVRESVHEARMRNFSRSDV